MRKIVQLALVALLLAVRANATTACPVLLVSGTCDHDGITVTFRNLGKLPIRRMEFNCLPLDAKTGRVHPGAHCSEQNASFIPRAEYTVNYTYPGGKPGPLLMSLRSVTFSGRHIFKPYKRDPCRVLEIPPPHAK